MAITEINLKRFSDSTRHGGAIPLCTENWDSQNYET